MLRGSTGLVKLLCKGHKEQKGKRKHHEEAPHLKTMEALLNGFGQAFFLAGAVRA